MITSVGVQVQKKGGRLGLMDMRPAWLVKLKGCRGLGAISFPQILFPHVGLGQLYVSHSRVQLEHTIWNTESDTESNTPTELLEDMPELQEE